MNKRMREILAQIKAKTDEAQSYLNGETKDLDKAEACMAEVAELQKEYAIEEAIVKAGATGVPTTPVTPEAPKDSVKALADAARAGFKSMNEGAGVDGGYTVPEDILTTINHYKEARFSLGALIDRESVSTNSGRRTYQKRSQHAGFQLVGEGGKVGKTAKPQFETLEYTIKKYAGYLPVTNELLADSDANIAGVITSWLGEESIATENAQVIAKVGAVEATPITGIKDIKKALTVTLALFKDTAKIITNSDGLHYLDTLEDKNGRPLLSPDPAKPMEAFLSVGTRRVPVVVIPNEILPTAENKIPVWMGDLHAFMKKFDREQLTLTVSTSAAVEGFNAFEQDMTLFRAIEREDYQVKDAAAIVRGELTVTA
jgi:HK97 family phage major capsid protein